MQIRRKYADPPYFEVLIFLVDVNDAVLWDGPVDVEGNLSAGPIMKLEIFALTAANGDDFRTEHQAYGDWRAELDPDEGEHVLNVRRGLRIHHQTIIMMKRIMTMQFLLAFR